MNYINSSDVDLRDAFFYGLYEVIENDKNVIILTADHGALGLNKIKEDFPEQYVNVGIAEQNMVSVAAGLALSGKIVYIYSIVNFVTFRCLDQINIDIASMNLNVNIIGVGSGFTYSTDGPTHHGTQDVAIMSAIPNLSVYNCSDAVNSFILAKYGYSKPGSKYFRIQKGMVPKLYDISQFSVDNGCAQLESGGDITIISTGLMVHKANEVSHALNKHGYKVGVIDIYKINPFNSNYFLKLIRDTKKLLVIEDNIASGGIGEKISAVLSEFGYYIPIRRISVLDRFCYYQHINRESVESHCGLSDKNLISHMLSMIKE